MAHFAWVNQSDIVYDVSAVDNERLLDDDGIEQETLGIAHLESVHGSGIRWIQTSYNGNFRGRYAGIGYTYDPDLDEFVAPSPPTE